MDYFQFYNKDSRRWQLRKIRKYIKENGLSAKDEVSLYFNIVREVLKKKKISKYDKRVIVDLGFYLEQKPDKNGFVSRYSDSKPISDNELMKMSKEELISNWNRFSNVKGSPPDRYFFPGTLEQYQSLENRFNDIFREYIKEIPSIHSFEDCLTYGYYDHRYRNDIKYHLKDDVKIRTFVRALGQVFIGYKNYDVIAGMILETFDVSITYSTTFSYLTEQ